jgi:hypothetical protein
MKKSKWSRRIFDMVDWEAHGLAFRHLSHQQKITTTKLLHQLINTDRQNHLYYGDSTLCPCCKLEEETFIHVLSCADGSTANHHDLAQAQLTSSLNHIGTPKQIIEAIEHGFKNWLHPIHPVRAPMAGQLGSIVALLMIAFHEQFHDIGWLHLQLG